MKSLHKTDKNHILYCGRIVRGRIVALPFKRFLTFSKLQLDLSRIVYIYWYLYWHLINFNLIEILQRMFICIHFVLNFIKTYSQTKYELFLSLKVNTQSSKNFDNFKSHLSFCRTILKSAIILTNLLNRKSNFLNIIIDICVWQIKLIIFKNFYTKFLRH